MASKIGKVNKKEWFIGLGTAALTGGLTAIMTINGFTFNDFKPVIIAMIASMSGYILIKMGYNSEGKFLKQESK